MSNDATYKSYNYDYRSNKSEIDQNDIMVESVKRLPPPPSNNNTLGNPYLNITDRIDSNQRSNPTNLKLDDEMANIDLETEKKLKKKKKLDRKPTREYLEDLTLYIRDFNYVKIDELFVFDRRGFCKFLCDSLQSKHVIFNAFCYKTGLMPYYIRLKFFFLELCLAFVLNAIFYSDEYISERNRTILTTDMVKNYLNKNFNNFILFIYL